MGQITLKDIAKALNLSPSTVSRAMKDHPAISHETRELVQAYALEHKYKPNTLAMQLRTNRNNTIGVIVPEIVHYFFSTVLSGIQMHEYAESWRHNRRQRHSLIISVKSLTMGCTWFFLIASAPASIPIRWWLMTMLVPITQWNI